MSSRRTILLSADWASLHQLRFSEPNPQMFCHASVIY
jgi:hypothetical protein